MGLFFSFFFFFLALGDVLGLLGLLFVGFFSSLCYSSPLLRIPCALCCCVSGVCARLAMYISFSSCFGFGSGFGKTGGKRIMDGMGWDDAMSADCIVITVLRAVYTILCLY
ncbi:hypothetical protein FN846DRAFT_924849 [Sphaerosporella brunnea]|uniref:Uncharacterized protein n=1 Tax=Sphaerosporella brunnea TaxID=1250544 RepID=A0A5J5FB24_9PEZI|nr:hypothetical protein FN846DRAFT_924849 [Sphaerosporella brunnea]